MEKSKANEILDRIRNGETMSVALATEALQATGDIARLCQHERASSPTLCVDGNEQRFNRPCTLYDTPVGERVGWSRYLDCKTNQGIEA